MRKFAWLGVLLVLGTGCGRSCLSLRGAGCRSGGCQSAPMLPPPPQADAGCQGCGPGYGAGYSAYDSGEIIGDTGYNGIITEGYTLPGGAIEGSLVPPSISTPAT